MRALKEVGVIVLLLVAAASSGCGGPPSESELVLKTARRYGETEINSGTDYAAYGEIYDMLSEDAKPIIFESWAGRKKSEKNIRLSQGVTFEFIKAENPRITGDVAKADILFKKRVAGLVQTKTITISLVKEDGNWKIAEDVCFTC